MASLYLIQNERVRDEGVEHIPRGSRRAHAVAVVDVLMIRIAIHEDTDRLAQRDRPGSFRFVDVLRRRDKPVPALWIGCIDCIIMTVTMQSSGVPAADDVLETSWDGIATDIKR